MTDLRLDDVDGLSGLTKDETGALWTVPESSRMLLRIRSGRVDRRLPVSGIPHDVDLEALVWLGRGRFALGTESKTLARPVDDILVVDATKTPATVVDRIAIPYSALPISAAPNRGIEGLCYAQGHFLVAFEEPLVDDEKRKAVIVHRTPESGLRVLTLPLMSKSGKISGLDCSRAGDTLKVVAIERHFGLRRVLAFSVTLSSQHIAPPNILYDLEDTFDDDVNPEGIVELQDSILLVTDNHYGTRNGPSQLIRLRRSRGR